MGIQISQDSDEEEVIGVINTTPLVDVMLVLLIIFLITIPVVTQTVALKLPEDHALRYQPKLKTITLAINSKGELFWNAQSIADQDLLPRLQQALASNPNTEVNIRGDQNTAFESIGKVIDQVQRAGINKVAFITQPTSY